MQAAADAPAAIAVMGVPTFGDLDMPKHLKELAKLTMLTLRAPTLGRDGGHVHFVSFKTTNKNAVTEAELPMSVASSTVRDTYKNHVKGRLGKAGYGQCLPLEKHIPESFMRKSAARDKIVELLAAKTGPDDETQLVDGGTNYPPLLDADALRAAAVGVRIGRAARQPTQRRPRRRSTGAPWHAAGRRPALDL